MIDNIEMLKPNINENWDGFMNLLRRIIPNVTNSDAIDICRLYLDNTGFYKGFVIRVENSFPDKEITKEQIEQIWKYFEMQSDEDIRNVVTISDKNKYNHGGGAKTTNSQTQSFTSFQKTDPSPQIPKTLISFLLFICKYDMLTSRSSATIRFFSASFTRRFTRSFTSTPTKYRGSYTIFICSWHVDSSSAMTNILRQNTRIFG
jgi:hypothetical protein